MKTTIRVQRRFDYDNDYSIDINTNKDMTQEEYKTLVISIKQIQAVFDAYLDMLFAEKKKVKEEKK